MVFNLVLNVGYSLWLCRFRVNFYKATFHKMFSEFVKFISMDNEID